MIQNYLKIILRSLWKNRLFTILNITGLAVGISASWIIFRICTYEYSYNKSFSDRKSIFKVRTEFDFNGQSGNNEGITRPLYPLIKHEVTGISNVVPTFGFHVEKIKIPVKNKEHKIQEFNTFANASADFFDVFAFPIIAGNSKCLGSKDQMAISAEYADLFFGNIPLNDIIGQSIVLNDSLHFQVGAIFANTTKPSDITFKAYIPIDKSKIKEDEWANVNSSDQLYIKLDPASNHIDILKSINTLADSRSEQYLKFWGENTKRWFELTPLDEVHFMTNLGSNIRKANKNVLFILIGVAFFLLLLACINYINISVANLPNKSKEIGLKKTLGVSSTKIFIDYTIETGIILTMSTIMSFGLSELLYKAYPFLIPEGMSTYKDFPLYVAFLLCFLVLTTLITSIVPAWKMNQMQASDIIKNNFSTSQQGSVLTLNKSMVVFQFFIASVFIISSLIINRQINHLMTMDIGFEKNAVVTIGIPWEIIGDSIKNNKKFPLKQALQNNKNIKAISLSEPLLREGMSSNGFKRIDQDKASEVLIQRKPSDLDLLKVYDLKILAGRYVQQGDNGRKFVINAEASRQLGFAFPKDAIGAVIKENYSEENAEIIGVVNDFNTLGVSTPVNPVAIFHEPDQLSGFAVKLNENHPKKWQSTIKEIEASWHQFYPGMDFDYCFYDDTLEEMLKTERHMSSISNLATVITILLSCLGLFGLSLLMTYRRLKEIGIRKVFGASTSSIILGMSKNFLFLVFIAVIISIPLVHFLSNQFLENYPYRIEITPWYYIVGLCAMTFIAFITILYNILKAAMSNPTEVIK